MWASPSTTAERSSGLPPWPAGSLSTTHSTHWAAMMPHDPNRPEDALKVDEDEDEEGNGGDDMADALRYLAATKG